MRAWYQGGFFEGSTKLHRSGEANVQKFVSLSARFPDAADAMAFAD